jgi:hypothetical protein
MGVAIRSVRTVGLGSTVEAPVRGRSVACSTVLVPANNVGWRVQPEYLQPSDRIAGAAVAIER